MHYSKVRIGLWIDNHNFPSLLLMKLSTFHKGNGYKVETYMPVTHYYRLYCSKTFSFTDDIGFYQSDELLKAAQGTQ